MAAQSGLGFSGIVAINIPDDGAAGEVLTKLTGANYDYDWAPGGGGGGDVLTLTIPGGVFTLTQSSGVSPLTVDLVGGLGGGFLYKPGFLGGQLAHGGTVAGDILTLQGANNAPDVGIVRVNSPVELTYDTISNTTPAQQFAMRWAPAVASNIAYIGGALQVAADFTVTNGVFIPATFSDTSIVRMGVAPGFSAFTFINELAVIQNLGNFNLPSALVMNIGLTHSRVTAGTSTTPGTTGVSFSPQTRATVSGAVMTRSTGITAVRLSPTFSTVGGSTVNLGTIIGLDFAEPAVALFQPSSGVENMTAYYGINFPNFTFGGASATVNVIRSLLNAGTNKRFINHTGNAASTFRGNIVFDVDSVGLLMGLSGDSSMLYSGTANAIQYAVITPAVTVWQFSAPSAGRLLLQGAATILGEFNLNVSKFSFGAQSGTVGNQVGVFVAGTRTTSVAGGWSDFLLTQAGNITVNHAMSGLTGWSINAPAITLGTGSVTDAGALNVGGNVTEGSVNRFGVRIISNPTGGSGINAALWVTAGLSRFDGRVDINQPIALGGGAAATLGTIGGTGPTAAAQAQWVEIDVNGVAHWIPVWT